MFIYTMAQQLLSQYVLILASKELMEVNIMVVVVMAMVTKEKPLNQVSKRADLLKLGQLTLHLVFESTLSQQTRNSL